VLEAVLTQQPQWHNGDMASAWSAAAAAGLDVKRARATMLAPKVTAMMQQDVADGRALGVKGTLTFFVNGKPLTEFGMQQLEQQVRAEVEAGRR
jgi:protein-disulfide isomerase